MKKKTIFIGLFLVPSVLLLACMKQKPDWRYAENLPYSKQKPDWPNYIVRSLWIPEEAREIRYYTLPENYQITSEMNVCFPAANIIEEMVNDMTNKGWKRLEFDFLNPEIKIKLHHARPYDSLPLKWGHFSTQDGMNAYQWIEDWEDPQGNIIRYALGYRSKNTVPTRMCDLAVLAIYDPAETVRKMLDRRSEELKQLKK